MAPVCPAKAESGQRRCIVGYRGRAIELGKIGSPVRNEIFEGYGIQVRQEGVQGPGENRLEAA